MAKGPNYHIAKVECRWWAADRLGPLVIWRFGNLALWPFAPPLTLRQMPPAPSAPSVQSPPAPPSRPAVVLLSGGLDSATVLAIARSKGYACHCISFDYGQRHRWELAAAEVVARAHAAASFRVVSLDLRAIGGSALTADIAVPKDRDEAAMSGSIPVTYVPARNLVFLSLAAGLAEVVGARDIFIGVNAVDYSGYPDCRPEFLASFQRTVNLATKVGVEHTGEAGLQIHAPIVHMTKAEIIRTGTALGVNYGLTHSCYDPMVSTDSGPRPTAPASSSSSLATPSLSACGHCDSCILRRQGFADAGIADPTIYATNN